MLGKGTIQQKEIGQRFKDKQGDYNLSLIFGMYGLELNIRFGPADKIPVDGL